MSNNDPLMMEAKTTMYICIVLLLAGLFGAPEIYKHGLRYGACVEMCRPAKFDDDQNVNGGCLCIGSDKVLRLKKAP